MIQLQSEMLELRANPDKLATGHVIEARLDTGRGPVATVLIREGTLRLGNPVVCGVHHGKVRSLLNNLGQTVESAGPAMPVEILGLSGVPMAGDELIALADEKDAKQVGQHRMQRKRSKELAKSNRLSLDNLFEKMQEGETKTLNLIIKADVHGSVEALQDALIKLSNEEVSIEVPHAAAGTIIESDISLAAVSNAIVIGFNVRPTPKVQVLANEEHVDMRFYNVIYDVIKDVKNAIVGMMEAVFKEHILGSADVREVFQISKVGTVAGCFVTDGHITRGKPIRVIRDGVVVYDGKVASVRRFKDDVKEVQSGYECGITVERFNDIKAEDILECYEMEEIAPELT
jgi:translation initiation factor IF-2